MSFQETQSDNIEHETPRNLFDELDAEFEFTFDPCCRLGHYTAHRILERGTLVSGGLDYRGVVCIPPPVDDEVPIDDPTLVNRIKIDGLAQPWSGRVYMNPPYGREIGKWVAKASAEVLAGHVEFVVGLLPARTDPRWWQTYVLRGVRRLGPRGAATLVDAPRSIAEVRFLPGRLRFGDAPGPAKFPSAVVIWRGEQYVESPVLSDSGNSNG